MIDDYKKKREALTQEEINGLKQAEEELQKMARAYAQAQQKQAEAAKNTYNANQVKNISNRYIHCLVLQVVMSSLVLQVFRLRWQIWRLLIID